MSDRFYENSETTIRNIVKNINNTLTDDEGRSALLQMASLLEDTIGEMKRLRFEHEKLISKLSTIIKIDKEDDDIDSKCY